MSNQGDIQRYRQGNRKIRHYIWVCPGYDYQLDHMTLHWVGYLPRDAELALCDLFYSEILRCDVKGVQPFGFTLIRLASGQPPSPVKGEGLNNGTYPTAE